MAGGRLVAIRNLPGISIAPRSPPAGPQLRQWLKAPATTFVSEADKLFDHYLLQTGLARSSMGERLKAARPRFSSYEIYDAVWKAHKLRNALAHDVGFDLVASQARQAVADFGRGLKDLGGL
jgi:hypothetical protein